MYQDRLDHVEQHVPYPKTWLDVGCGGGGLLKCVKDAGYVVEGIEPSPAADYISLQYGITVHKKILSESVVDLCHSEYGVISYFHVLEHLHDPMTESLLVHKLLSNKGLLVIEVPFFDSLPWKLLGHRHRHFYHAHKSYFNKKSIYELLQRAGFRLIECERVPYYITIGWLLMRLGGVADIIHHHLHQNILERLIPISTGEYLLVIARKA